MSHVIGFKVETVSDERRDRILVALIEAANIALGGADELTMNFRTEDTPGYNVKKKTEYIVKWTPADDLPTLASFGIWASQRSMFSSDAGPDIRLFHAGLREALLHLKAMWYVPSTTAPASSPDPASPPEPTSADEVTDPHDAGAATDDLPSIHDQPAAPTDDPLGPFKRTIEDIERSQGYADDQSDEAGNTDNT